MSALAASDLTEAIAQANLVCAHHGQRLGQQSEEVLRLLLQAGRPVKAYDLIAQMAQAGHRTKPPVVYRALQMLVACGLVQRIETHSAFLAVPQPTGATIFMVCRHCGEVSPSALDVGPRLQSEADARGFHIERWALEVVGACHGCEHLRGNA